MTHTEFLERMMASTLKPKVELRRQGAFFRIPFWEHIAVADQDIFSKFGVYMNMLLHLPNQMITQLTNIAL